MAIYVIDDPGIEVYDLNEAMEKQRRIDEAHVRIRKQQKLYARRTRQQYRRLLSKIAPKKRTRYERMERKYGLEHALLLLLERRDPQDWYLWHLRRLPVKDRKDYAEIAKKRGPAAAIRRIHQRRDKAHPLY